EDQVAGIALLLGQGDQEHRPELDPGILREAIHQAARQLPADGAGARVATARAERYDGDYRPFAAGCRSALGAGGRGPRNGRHRNRMRANFRLPIWTTASSRVETAVSTLATVRFTRTPFCSTSRLAAPLLLSRPARTRSSTMGSSFAPFTETVTTS